MFIHSVELSKKYVILEQRRWYSSCHKPLHSARWELMMPTLPWTGA